MKCLFSLEKKPVRARPVRRRFVLDDDDEDGQRNIPVIVYVFIMIVLTLMFKNAPRSGRPVEADKDTIKTLVDANRRITTREIGLRLNSSNSTVYDHLKGLGLSSKLDVWVPHVLAERNLCRRIDVCDSLLKRHENYPFLKHMGRKRSWNKKDEPAQTISKADIHQKKLLPDNTTINSEVYCHQLDKLNDAFQQKRSELINRKGVVFHQDNARHHTSLVNRQKLLQLEWDTMPHPPYSPDVAP
ncbi:histone-lysine N-methyltransferase SETMAR [Trichonephila clavipes]|nr:histone-lysine N-methyltransferase SETMAR [Trichonephila clavipes]